MILSAIFVTQVSTLALLGLVILFLMVSPLLTAPRIRTAETWSLGFAFGLTTAVVGATFAYVIIPA